MAVSETAVGVPLGEGVVVGNAVPYADRDEDGVPVEAPVPDKTILGESVVPDVPDGPGDLENADDKVEEGEGERELVEYAVAVGEREPESVDDGDCVEIGLARVGAGVKDDVVVPEEEAVTRTLSPTDAGPARVAA